MYKIPSIQEIQKIQKEKALKQDMQKFNQKYIDFIFEVIKTEAGLGKSDAIIDFSKIYNRLEDKRGIYSAMKEIKNIINEEDGYKAKIMCSEYGDDLYINWKTWKKRIKT